MPLSVKGDRLLDVIARPAACACQVNELYVVLQRNGVTERVPLRARRPTTAAKTSSCAPATWSRWCAIRRRSSPMAPPAGNTEIPFGADSITLAQALAKVGGLHDNRADAQRRVRFPAAKPEPSQGAEARQPARARRGPIPVVYHLDLQNPNSLFMQQRFQIANRDLVYVSNAPTVELEKAIAIFYGALSPVVDVRDDLRRRHGGHLPQVDGLAVW